MASSSEYLPLDKQPTNALYPPHSFPPQMHSADNRRSRPSISFLRGAVDIFKALLLPVIAIAYLAFCYTVHRRVVPLRSNISFIDLESYDLRTIKSGVTSFSILIISLGLYPLNSLIQDLHSEEFFRALKTRPNGVRFATLNSISSPSFGVIDTLIAIIKRQSSSYFAVAFVSSFVVLAVSTLAPSALSVELMLIDGGVVAFSVGAIPANSVLNTTDLSALTWQQPTSAVTNLTQMASSIAWAEHSLSAQYKLEVADAGDGRAYVVPMAAEMNTTTSARWITDLIVLQPKCSWMKTNISGTLTIDSNTTGVSDDVYASLPELDAEVEVPWSSIDIFNFGIFLLDPFKVRNASTHDPTPAGLSVWLIVQPNNKTLSSAFGDTDIEINMSSISDATFKLAVDTTEYNLAYLVCAPNSSIETRKVRADGAGKLFIEEGVQSTKQRNLQQHQTGFLLSFALSKMHDSAGPQVVYSGFGSKLEMELIFGKSQADAFTGDANFTFTPAAAEDATKLYSSLVQSAMKPFTDGALGTTNVPARLARQTAVFTSSFPIIIVSTLLFAVLSAVVLVSHFRHGKEEYFTLFSVGAALDNSGLPAHFAQMRSDGVEDIGSSVGSSAKRKAEQLGDKVTVMQTTYEGGQVLHVI
ncbi:hypothetical protein BDZ89DRAFT_1055770, partial [Hymenopellis radicata]